MQATLNDAIHKMLTLLQWRF